MFIIVSLNNPSGLSHGRRFFSEQHRSPQKFPLFLKISFVHIKICPSLIMSHWYAGKKIRFKESVWKKNFFTFQSTVIFFSGCFDRYFKWTFIEQYLSNFRFLIVNLIGCSLQSDRIHLFIPASPAYCKVGVLGGAV